MDYFSLSGYSFPIGYIGRQELQYRSKEARLEADVQASAVVGKNLSLDVLKKIDNMGLNDVEGLKSGRGGPSSRKSS